MTDRQEPDAQGAAASTTAPPIEIVPYDPSWPALFEAERLLLEAVLAPWLAGPIEHVGSTAVAGLAAKPVIDIMAPVVTLESSRPAIAAVAVLGYGHFPYRAETMHWLCKPSPLVRTHHLHLVPLGSELWLQRLAFRDALRNDAALAAAYAALKRQLAARFGADRDGYTDAKTPFIHRALRGRASGNPVDDG